MSLWNPTSHFDIPHKGVYQNEEGFKNIVHWQKIKKITPLNNTKKVKLIYKPYGTEKLK